MALVVGAFVLSSITGASGYYYYYSGETAPPELTVGLIKSKRLPKSNIIKELRRFNKMRLKNTEEEILKNKQKDIERGILSFDKNVLKNSEMRVLKPKPVYEDSFTSAMKEVRERLNIDDESC